jgi:hypothetical protein
MQIQQAADQRQAKAQSSGDGLNGSTALYERLKHATQHVIFDALSVVRDGHYDAGSIAASRDPYLAAGRSVLGRVREQIGKHLRQTERITTQR